MALPGWVNATVACPSASVVTGAPAPVMVAPGASVATPLLLNRLTLTGMGSPTFALLGALIPSGVGAGSGHALPKQLTRKSTRSPGLTCASQAPISDSFSFNQKDQK